MIRAKTITEAQYKLSQACMLGYGQFVQHGEFANTETFRVQSEPVHVLIKEPLNFFDLPKEIPFSVIEEYELDLLNPVNDDPADYTYGERIMQQLPAVMQMLADSPATNQAIVEVAQPSDIKLEHMPCLRSFQFVLYRGRLNMIVNFRSNDVGEAFIINHGGLALILRDVAEFAGISPGEYHYFSPGAHLYSHSL